MQRRRGAWVPGAARGCVNISELVFRMRSCWPLRWLGFEGFSEASFNCKEPDASPPPPFPPLSTRQPPVRGPIYPRARPSRMVSSATDPHLSTRIIVRYRFNPPPGIALLRDPLYICIYILPIAPSTPQFAEIEKFPRSSALIRFVYRAIGSS